MCRATKCRQCGKTTWAGCGQHIASVKAGVPAGQWCNGQHEKSASAGDEKSGGVFSRLFGR